MNERGDGRGRSIKRYIGLAISAVCVALLAFAFIRGWFMEYPLYADMFHNDPESIEVTGYGHTHEYRQGDVEYGHVLGILRGTRYDSVIRRQLAQMGIGNWGGVTTDGTAEDFASKDVSNGIVIKVTYLSPQKVSPDYSQLVSVIYLLPLDRGFTGKSMGRWYMQALFDNYREGFGYLRITPELKAYCDSLGASSKAQ